MIDIVKNTSIIQGCSGNTSSMMMPTIPIGTASVVMTLMSNFTWPASPYWTYLPTFRRKNPAKPRKSC